MPRHASAPAPTAATPDRYHHRHRLRSSCCHHLSLAFSLLPLLLSTATLSRLSTALARCFFSSSSHSSSSSSSSHLAPPSHLRLSASDGQRTFVVVGLGNPGSSFIGTRHNVGRDAVTALLSSDRYRASVTWAETTVHRCRYTAPILLPHKQLPSMDAQYVMQHNHSAHQQPQSSPSTNNASTSPHTPPLDHRAHTHLSHSSSSCSSSPSPSTAPSAASSAFSASASPSASASSSASSSSSSLAATSALTAAARLAARCSTPPSRVMFIESTRYMNECGQSIANFLAWCRLPLACPAEHLIVLSDDIALPAGTLRIRQHGSHGGHNGLRDIMHAMRNTNFHNKHSTSPSPTTTTTTSHVTSDSHLPFIRVRIGVDRIAAAAAAASARSMVDLTPFVLGAFEPGEERAAIDWMQQTVLPELIEVIVTRGVHAAQMRWADIERHRRKAHTKRAAPTPSATRSHRTPRSTPPHTT